MYSHPMEINYTSHKSILKISLGFFISQFESFEFSRNSSASNPPLAASLFKLPFIDVIYLGQDYIALKLREDELWNTLREEQVVTLITAHLTAPESILKPTLRHPNKKVPISVYTENTQNALVLKFVCSIKLTLQSEEYLSVSETESAPIARELFGFDAVKHVFINANYIAVTKTNQTDWMMASLGLREFIRHYLMRQKPVIINHSDAIPGTVVSKSTEDSLDEISKKVITVINGDFQTALRQDGGAIKFHSFDSKSKTLTVVAQGACRYSPAVRDSIKEGLAPRLEEALPDAISHIELLSPRKKQSS